MEQRVNIMKTLKATITTALTLLTLGTAQYSYSDCSDVLIPDKEKYDYLYEDAHDLVTRVDTEDEYKKEKGKSGKARYKIISGSFSYSNYNERRQAYLKHYEQSKSSREQRSISTEKLPPSQVAAWKDCTLEKLKEKGGVYSTVKTVSENLLEVELNVVVPAYLDSLSMTMTTAGVENKTQIEAIVPSTIASNKKYTFFVTRIPNNDTLIAFNSGPFSTSIFKPKVTYGNTFSVQIQGVDDYARCFLNGNQVASNTHPHVKALPGYKHPDDGGNQPVNLSSKMKDGENILRCQVKNQDYKPSWGYSIKVLKDGGIHHLWDRNCTSTNECEVPNSLIVFDDGIKLYKASKS